MYPCSWNIASRVVSVVWTFVICDINCVYLLDITLNHWSVKISLVSNLVDGSGSSKWHNNARHFVLKYFNKSFSFKYSLNFFNDQYPFDEPSWNRLELFLFAHVDEIEVLGNIEVYEDIGSGSSFKSGFLSIKILDPVT